MSARIMTARIIYTRIMTARIIYARIMTARMTARIMTARRSSVPLCHGREIVRFGRPSARFRDKRPDAFLC